MSATTGQPQNGNKQQSRGRHSGIGHGALTATRLLPSNCLYYHNRWHSLIRLHLRRGLGSKAP